MLELLTKLHYGIAKKDLNRAELDVLKILSDKHIVKSGDILRISPKFRVGSVDISRSGLGFFSPMLGEKERDLLIDREDVGLVEKNDIIVAKIEFHKGKPIARVVLVVQKSYPFIVVYLKKQGKQMRAYNIKTDEEIHLDVRAKELSQLPNEVVLKVDNTTKAILEVLGVLSDPYVDEKISLALYDKKDEFDKRCISEARAYGDEVDKQMYPNRTDITHLPLCTIDPVDAKDFDDAIFFDPQKNELIVAIADVSEYVTAFSALDAQARRRGFTIYFPHRSVPMLPRELSENLCSLKPQVDRLAFVFRMRIDPVTLQISHYDLFEAVIHSSRRYNYDQVDEFMQGQEARDDTDGKILKWLLPLAELTDRMRQKRLKNGFDFAGEEIRMTLGEAQSLLSTTAEVQTRSHQLIEECMLAANRCAAQYFDYGIFRCHDQPQPPKIKELRENLAALGLNSKAHVFHQLVEDVQEQTRDTDMQKYVDRLIIRAQQQAVYRATNIGHYGLGFDRYTHFTSPIRRYSDLVLHRLLKTYIMPNEKAREHLLKDIEAICFSVSVLEREAAKVAWDFMDRKYARWAQERIGESLDAKVSDIDEEGRRDTILKVEGEIFGARVFVRPHRYELFEDVTVQIERVDIAKAKIYGRVVERKMLG